MAVSELLKDLPCKNSVNFSQYCHGSFKASCESKKYVKLKAPEEQGQAQMIEMDETSLLKRELLKLQNKSSVIKKPVKRSSQAASKSKKLRRLESNSGGEEGGASDNEDSNEEMN